MKKKVLLSVFFMALFSITSAFSMGETDDLEAKKFLLKFIIVTLPSLTGKNLTM